MKNFMGKAFAKLKTLFKESKYIVAVVVLCCAAVALIGCFFAYAALYENVLPNVYVENVNIGRMTPIQADLPIREAFEIGIIEGRSIGFECGSNYQDVKLNELGTKVNIEGTIDKAYNVGREGGIFRKTAKLFLSAFKKTEVPLEVSVDETKLEKLISELAAGKEIEPEPAGYSIDGKQLTLKKGHGG